MPTIRKKLALLKELPRDFGELYIKLLGGVRGGGVMTSLKRYSSAFGLWSGPYSFRPYHYPKSRETRTGVVQFVKRGIRERPGHRLGGTHQVIVRPLAIKKDKIVRLLYQTVRDLFTLQSPATHDNLPQSPSPFQIVKLGPAKYTGASVLSALPICYSMEFSAGPLKIQLNDMLQAEFLLECEEDFKNYTGEFRFFFFEYASIYWAYHRVSSGSYY